MTPDEAISYVMSIQDEKELINSQNYKKIRNGIGYILLYSDRYEKLLEGFEHTGLSYSEIDDAIEYHIGQKHIISKLLRKQLEELEQNNCIQINGFFYPYNIRLIYWKMEEICKGSPSLEIKGFNREGLLKRPDLFHVHHNQTNSIGLNAKRYLDAHYKSPHSFQRKISELKTRRNNPTVRELLSDFTYTILMDSLNSEKRDNDWKMTGEWIVFQKLKNDRINFLCLSTHDEGSGDGEILNDKIKDYIR
ncbi:MAG: hypothetical protein PQJ61_04625 [Spirochaetales bacterium]|uniref:Uncharacterized protein n=1 Tax=Candidatus Thalassospirochaeta sargassi TaxID=3119039 RepID=A0AAJ1IDV7_9SPIO|nr:hypothetical protein [Spirochaetales bacterium]